MNNIGLKSGFRIQIQIRFSKYSRIRIRFKIELAVFIDKNDNTSIMTLMSKEKSKISKV